MSDAVQQELGRRIDAVIEQGRAETPDFDERSALVVALGAAERPEFARAIAMLPNAHRVVSALADNPEEAMRVLSLPSGVMAAELAKLATKPAAPRPATQAPTRPAGPDTAKMSPREFIEWRNKQERTKREAKPDPGPRVSEADMRKLSGRAFIEARNRMAPVHLGGRGGK